MNTFHAFVLGCFVGFVCAYLFLSLTIEPQIRGNYEGEPAVMPPKNCCPCYFNQVDCAECEYWTMLKDCQNET